MRKVDVETRGGYPALDVKYRGRMERDCPLPMSLGGCDSGDGRGMVESMTPPGFTWDWIRAQDDDRQHAWWEWACESGWEDAQSSAEDIFGKRAKVYSDGRSGGWLVVHGLPPVESWDAIMLGKWSRYAARAREAVKGLAYSVAWNAYTHGFEPDVEAMAESANVDTTAGPAAGLA